MVVCLVLGTTTNASSHMMHFDRSDVSEYGITVVKHDLRKRDIKLVAITKEQICQDQENKFLRNEK